MMSTSEYSRETEFLKDGPWDELYVITQYWKSDLEFYRDDLRFLHYLVDKYFIWITKAENIDMVKSLKNSLLVLNEEVTGLLDKIGSHRIRLGYLVENPRYADATVMKRDHAELEREMALFVKSFRKNRKEVFKITEYIVDSEKLASVMDS